MAISSYRVDPFVERQKALESFECFKREHPDRPNRVWAHVARSCGYSSDAVDFALSHVGTKNCVDAEALDDVLRRSCPEYAQAFSVPYHDLSTPVRDPAPQYPRWVVVLCVILSIVLFVLGFLFG